MAGFNIILVGFVLIATKCNVTLAYEYCGGRYCSDDCCGSGYSRICCSSSSAADDVVDAVSYWKIIVGVVGGIVLLSTIISCICAIYKQHNKPNRVVRPTAGTVSATTTTMAQQPGYNMAPQPHYSGYPVPGYTGYPQQHVAAYPGIQNYPPPYSGKSDNASSDVSSVNSFT